MNLDSNLIKEFAKITNDTEVKNENKYLRGTVVKNSGGKYVQIDGSTTVTPISELVDVQEGDRVLVSIENHKATIVGNYSFPPSARKEQEAIDKAEDAKDTADGVAGTANAAQQKAQEASAKADEAVNQSSIASASANEAKDQATEAINKANAAQENIQEAKNLANQASADATEAKNQAAASQASSAEAQAEVTRLNNEVKAAQQDIEGALEELEAQADEIAGVKENYATKVEMGETKASLETEIVKKVGELQTTIAKDYATKTENVELEGRLQTQITQNAEGIASQASKTEKIEADTAKAQQDVANALSKANAAQNTAAEAQAVADAAQAAANTATSDAQAAANKAQLAQNAAEAATAAANAADKAVQEAQGDLDEAKQNLANVTSRVDATEAEIAEAQAKVDAAQEEVNEALADAAEARLAANNATEAANKAQQDAETAKGVANTAQQKADNAKTAADNAQAAADKAQADVAALTKRVTTAETNILQNSEQIELNASKTVEIGEKVDNLEVGARNLLYYSKMDKSYDGRNWSFIGLNTVTSRGYDEYELAYHIITPASGHNTNNGAGIRLNIWDSTNKIHTQKVVNPGETYSFSIDVKGVINNTDTYAGYIGIIYNADETKAWYANINRLTDIKTELLEDEYTRFSMTFEVPTIAIYNFGVQLFLGYNADIYIRNAKLEKGNKPTDWTPAPEDIENDLINNYYTKTQTDAQIKVQSDRITSTVSKVETVEKTANDAKTSINNLQVGGRNYALGTSASKTIAGANKSNQVAVLYSMSINWQDLIGKEATISFDYEFSEGSSRTDGGTTTVGIVGMNVDPWNRWGKIPVPSTALSGHVNDTTVISKATSGQSISARFDYFEGSIIISNLKLEIGNKATDWSPAPEDVSSSISDAQNTANNAQNTANNAQSDIDNLQVGGTNLIIASDFRDTTAASSKWVGEGATITYGIDDPIYETYMKCEFTKEGRVYYGTTNVWVAGQDYAVSFMMKTDTEGTTIKPSRSINSWGPEIAVTTEWKRYTGIINNTVTADAGTLSLSVNQACTLYITDIKLEKGNKATAWSPAPEDVDKNIADAQSTADNAETIANANTTSVSQAHSRIEQLSTMIANLVTDENGTSLMTQTSDGWTFNMSSINSNLATLADEMDAVEDGQKDTNDALDRLKDLVDSVEAKTAYITIGKDDDGNPCIELGKTDNDFKVRITNTAIDFLEGSTKIAYVNNNTFYTEKMIVKNELQIGEGPGFVWRTRANGNMGLVYIT